MTYMASSQNYASIDSLIGSSTCSSDRSCSPRCGSGYDSGAIQHSIAAYPTLENSIDAAHTQYRTINLDSTPEFISPYQRTSASVTVSDAGYGCKKSADAADGSGYSRITVTTMQDNVTFGLLRKNRPYTQFIKDAEQIKDYIIETFRELTGKEFPKDVVLSVCDEKELRKIHEQSGGTWNPGIMGFAINRRAVGEVSELFVRQNDLDALMLTIGHEIGHVFTDKLASAVDEEAKAFAFEIAWMKTIIDKNIADLQFSFNPLFSPAQNGVHDVAFKFVKEVMLSGKTALDIYWELAKKEMRVLMPVLIEA